MRFQRRAVTVERVGWIFMAAFIVAALAGLFGPGPLSHSRAASDDGRLVIEFSRFLRNGSTTTLDVRLILDDPSAQPRLLIDTDYLATYTVDDLQPAPDQVINHGAQTEFVFAPPQDASDVSVSFDLRAGAFGTRSATFEADGSSATVSQFIYP